METASRSTARKHVWVNQVTDKVGSDDMTMINIFLITIVTIKYKDCQDFGIKFPKIQTLHKNRVELWKITISLWNAFWKHTVKSHVKQPLPHGFSSPQIKANRDIIPDISPTPHGFSSPSNKR